MIDRGTPRTLLVWGLGFAILEALLLTTLFWTRAETGLKVLSMIGACHLGGRLAFIGTGFEVGIPAVPIMAIIGLHNTTLVLVAYSLAVLMSRRIGHMKFIARLQVQVAHSRKFCSPWNLIAIAVFIWIPLPMTGAVIGALIAFAEGYEHRQIIPVALGSMWIGVITWTLAFERLYEFMHDIGFYATTVCTALLVLLPLLWSSLLKHSQQQQSE